jgi:hypothetical protein
MSVVIVSLLVAAVVCGALWRRPDARAALGGAWQAGRAQAAAEFRQGYQFTQARLRAGDPSWKNPRRWVSAGLATGYGTAATIAAANRIRRAAIEGARERRQQWQRSRLIDAEVIEDIEVVKEPEKTGEDSADCPRCSGRGGMTVICMCRPTTVVYPPQPAEPQPREDAQPEDPQPDPQPEQTPVSPTDQAAPEHNHPQEETMQTEATGLTSYAHAHEQLANELRQQVSGSESLAASMSNVLAEHSTLIGDTAVLQDLLTQAAAVADRIAANSHAIANN